MEWRSNYRRNPKHVVGLVGPGLVGEGLVGPGIVGSGAEHRFKRDVSVATKYIETALVIDKAMVSVLILDLILFLTKFRIT